MDDPTTVSAILGTGLAVAAGVWKTLDKLLPTKTNGAAPNGNGNGNGSKLEAAIQHLVEAMDRHHDEEVKLLNQLVVAVTVMATKFDERMQRRDV